MWEEPGEALPWLGREEVGDGKSFASADSQAPECHRSQALIFDCKMNMKINFEVKINNGF